MANHQYTLSADGQTGAFKPASSCGAKDCFLHIDGSFGGGTLVLQAAPYGTTDYVNVESASWTSEIGTSLIAHPDVQYRFSLSGATSPSIAITVSY
jgi:hypothetical protein